MAGRYNLRQTTVIERAKRAAAPAPAPPRRPRNAAATAAAKPAAAPKRKAGAPAGRGRPKKKPATKAAKGRGRARDADSEDDELEDDDQDNNDGPPFAEPPAADPPVAEPPAADPPAEERDLGGDNAEGRDNGTLDEENRLEEERLQEGARERERREEEEGNRREDERIQEEIRERERREEEEKKQREEEEAKERERREMAPPDRDQTLDENPPGGNDEPPPEKPRSGGAAAGAENATGDDNATGGGIAAARDSGAAAGDENAAQSNGAAAGDNKAPGSGGATAGVGVTTGATAGAGGEDDLRDYESYEAQERDQDRPISPVYEPTSPGPPSLTQYWDNFMAQFLDDQQELRLKWRPLRSRALLLEALTEGVGETTEVEPPMYIDELHYERTLSDLNAADLDRFGPLADRPNFTSFDDPTHPHCAEHRYNEWAMTMIWAQHAAKLNSTAGKDEATWCCHRAVIQLQSLEDRDRWILPDDDEDDPLIPAKTFLDGMGPENVRMNPLKARALDILSLGVRVAPHLQGKWYKLDFLGAGGFGRAYAYGQYDDRGRLCDRVVVKDSYMSMEHWKDKDCPFHWKKNSRDEWEPKESFIMERLQPLITADTPLVLMRAHALMPTLGCYRLYLELCPHGDLHDLIAEHRSMIGRRDQDGDPIDAALPESVLWSLFERLIDAVCILHNGHVEGDEPPKDGWEREIVHLDIKPVNIFLADPATDVWPRYPIFKLGDLGHSDETYDGDPRNPGNLSRNPNDFFCMGTPGFSAPEQEGRPPGARRRDYRMSAYTSVWACANVVLQVMGLETMPEQISYRRGPDRPQRQADVFDSYSEELREVLDWCLDPTPSERPELSVLRDYIRAFVEVGPEGKDETESLRFRNDRDDWINYRRHLKYELWAQTG